MFPGPGSGHTGRRPHSPGWGVLILNTMEREQFSCDEEELEQYDTLTSVSQDTSSRVARSIVSSIFRRLPASGDQLATEERELELHTAAAAVTAAACSDTEQEEEEVEEAADPGSLVTTRSSASLETVQQLESLAREHDTFKQRIAEWITTVTFRDDPDTAGNHDSTAGDDTGEMEMVASTPEGAPTDSAEDEDDDVSDDDDQPAGVASPAPVLSVSNFTNISDEDFDAEAIEELKRRFQAERGSFVTSSILPASALRSFEQGFSNVRQANGNELFENGVGRNVYREDPFKKHSMWPTENNIFKNYHIKVLETTEQKVKVNPDGTREVDTLHKKEHSEKVFDDQSFKGFWIKMFILFFLALSLLVAAYIFKVHENIDIYCHVGSKNVNGAFNNNEDIAKKVYIEL